MCRDWKFTYACIKTSVRVYITNNFYNVDLGPELHLGLHSETYRRITLSWKRVFAAKQHKHKLNANITLKHAKYRNSTTIDNFMTTSAKQCYQDVVGSPHPSLPRYQSLVLVSSIHNLNTSDSGLHHTISLIYVGARHLEIWDYLARSPVRRNWPSSSDCSIQSVPQDSWKYTLLLGLWAKSQSQDLCTTQLKTASA